MNREQKESLRGEKLRCALSTKRGSLFTFNKNVYLYNLETTNGCQKYKQVHCLV